MVRIILLCPIHQVWTDGVIERLVEREWIAMCSCSVEFLLGHVSLACDGCCTGSAAAVAGRTLLASLLFGHDVWVECRRRQLEVMVISRERESRVLVLPRSVFMIMMLCACCVLK